MQFKKQKIFERTFIIKEQKYLKNISGQHTKQKVVSIESQSIKSKITLKYKLLTFQSLKKNQLQHFFANKSESFLSFTDISKIDIFKNKIETESKARQEKQETARIEEEEK